MTKNQRALSALYRQRTGRTTHTPPPDTDRAKLAQYFIPKVSQELR